LDNPRKFDETSEFEGEVHDSWQTVSSRRHGNQWRGRLQSKDTTRNFIDALLLSARKIASDQQVVQITTALRTRRFPMPGSYD
jgi:hypothetical protein